AQTWKLNWLSTIRGRIGTLMASPDTLIYFTGGAAVGKASYNVRASLGPASITLFDDKTKWGYTLGAGVEKRFNQNWSARLEYLYVNHGSYTFLNTISDTKLRDHILRVGINYAFR